MKIAPLPSNERVRLEQLWAYGVLDTADEQAYDDITQLAATICDTPIALVSLVDEDRQWFKSRVGLDARETPRDVAFCAHAILQPEHLMLVADAREDERFADNPLVVGDPRIRFYAGAPLVTACGEALGTLCVIDREPRVLSERQTVALGALSRQVMAQVELRRALRELRRFGEDMERLHDALQGKTTELERLYHTVSHELKTPLTAAREFIALLGDGVAGPVSELQAEYLWNAAESCDQLAGMLDNWLETVRSETGKLRLDPEPVSVSDLLDERSRRRYEVLACGRDLAFRWSIEPEVPETRLDVGKVHQVLGNLIGNAIKFTEDGGTISVAAGYREGEVVIRVEDTGRGIQPSHLEHIFSPFYQAQDADAALEGGMGLGLYVCRSIIDLHGGELIVESQPGVGTRATIRLPLERAAATAIEVER